MCQQVSLEVRPLIDPRLDSVLNRLRETHANGGALFGFIQRGSKRNLRLVCIEETRLLEFGHTQAVLDRIEVMSARTGIADPTVETG